MGLAISPACKFLTIKRRKVLTQSRDGEIYGKTITNFIHENWIKNSPGSLNIKLTRSQKYIGESFLTPPNLMKNENVTTCCMTMFDFEATGSR